MGIGKEAEELSLHVRLRRWAQKLKQDIITLYFSLRHPHTPIFTKIIAAVVVGYALSPIDLIPDFIPILGYLDEMILLPLGIALVVKLMPKEVLETCREEARTNPPSIKPTVWAAGYIIIIVWVIFLYGIYIWFQ